MGTLCLKTTYSENIDHNKRLFSITTMSILNGNALFFEFPNYQELTK